MSTPAGTVYLVDDEPRMLKAITRLLKTEGFPVSGFSSARAFLEAYVPDSVGCLVLDVAMPGLDGLELQRHLTRAGVLIPIVFLTGHGDIPMSVRAIKAGALDFLTKPVVDTDLIRAVRDALQRAVEQQAAASELATLRQHYGTLTPREREVLARVVVGELNKQVAGDLGIGEHTVKVHRAHVMEKMGVASLAELVRIAARLGVDKSATGGA